MKTFGIYFSFFDCSQKTIYNVMSIIFSYLVGENFSRAHNTVLANISTIFMPSLYFCRHSGKINL